MARVDVQAIRAAHRIEDVVAASGVELRPSGRAFVARCPFHVEDRHPSMSVGGVAGRYHCFACGAGGDVIDYVARFNGIGFRDAADRLTAGAAFTGRIPTAVPLPRRTTDAAVLDRTSATRIFEINELAWRYFTERPNLDHAEWYMLTERHIDVRAIRSETDGQPLVGYAPSTWHRLSDTLLREGVTPDELVDADLASRRDYRLVDAFRGRVIVPVRDYLGRLEGFIGRDITGDATAAKYRNPTRTATFDKSRALYRPTRQHLDPDGQAIVVEGVMDALAVTAAAATTGALHRFAACTTSGVTVSRVQAIKVVAISANPVIIALDGDQAGAEGTARWLSWIETTIGRSAVALRLPDGVDPAEWLANRGPRGLALFSTHGRPPVDPAPELSMI
jgi:DNA primase